MFYVSLIQPFAVSMEEAAVVGVEDAQDRGVGKGCSFPVFNGVNASCGHGLASQVYYR